MTSLRHNEEPQTSPKDAYLDAARACILDVGWRRTTLTEVARRAGVSRIAPGVVCSIVVDTSVGTHPQAGPDSVQRRSLRRSTIDR